VLNWVFLIEFDEAGISKVYSSAGAHKPASQQ
jgi:hypothetical protein